MRQITNCLRCNNVFKSEGIKFNRVCPNCKAEFKQWRESIYEMMPIHNWVNKLLRTTNG